MRWLAVALLASGCADFGFGGEVVSAGSVGGADVGLGVEPDPIGACGPEMSPQCVVKDGLCVDAGALVDAPALDVVALTDAAAADCVPRAVLACDGGATVVWVGDTERVVAYDAEGLWAGERVHLDDDAFGPICGDTAYLGSPALLDCVLGAMAAWEAVPEDCDGSSGETASCAPGSCLIDDAALADGAVRP